MYTNILGYKVFNKSFDDLLREVDKRDKVNIISVNPEVLYNGLNNDILNKNFNEDYSIIIPDGVGTVLASKMLKNPVKEKIAGIEVMRALLEKCAKEKKGVYLLGAKEEVLKGCILKLLGEIEGLNIVGSHNGYFDINNCQDIIADIKNSNAYAIFVAMGSPRQEKFIEEHNNELPCKIFMGVGGSFDVFAGNVKRAPKWMINMGLEWLYRVSKEPWRIKRLTSIPKFLWMVFRNKNK